MQEVRNHPAISIAIFKQGVHLPTCPDKIFLSRLTILLPISTKGHSPVTTTNFILLGNSLQLSSAQSLCILDLLVNFIHMISKDFPLQKVTYSYIRYKYNYTSVMQNQSLIIRGQTYLIHGQ